MIRAQTAIVGGLSADTLTASSSRYHLSLGGLSSWGFSSIPAQKLNKPNWQTCELNSHVFFDLQSAHLRFAASKDEQKIHSEPSSGSCFWWKRGRAAAIQMSRFLRRKATWRIVQHTHLLSQMRCWRCPCCWMIWSSVPHDVRDRAATANVIKMTAGTTRFAVTRIGDFKTCFELFMSMLLSFTGRWWEQPWCLV